MSSRLCPFCNSESRMATVKDVYGDTFYYRVCKHCGCRTEAWRSKEKAEEMWNRRVEPTMMQLEIERIVSELKKIPIRSIAVIKAIKIVEGWQRNEID